MDYEKVTTMSYKLLDTLGNTSLTYEETFEVLKILTKALNSALYQQTRIEISFIEKQIQNKINENSD